MFIRPAIEADRAAILSLMRPSDFNRINLRPACFLVAEEAGQVIGIGQIKRHRDGTPELASLVVAAHRRGEGIGQALVGALVGSSSVAAETSTSTVRPAISEATASMVPR